MSMRTVVISSVLAVSIPTGFVRADAANGKPFVEVAGQIAEVQNQVTNLQAQVDNAIGEIASLEERVTAAEDAIAALQQENVSLQAQINANTGDVASLQAQVADNIVLIAALGDEIDLIEDLLAFKQTVISGSCTAGFAIRQVNADGSVVCEPAGGAAGALDVVTVTMLIMLPAGGTNSATALCPAGSLTTGGGFRIGPNVVISDSRPVAGGWSVIARNAGGAATPIVSFTQCAQIL